MNLILLKEQLIERWVNAFDEISLINEFEKRAVDIKFARSSRYEVKDYCKGKIKARGKFLPGKPADAASDPFVYGVDENGLPCFSFFSHTWNKIAWKGFYSFSDEMVEYVEFCLNTKVPSCIQRIVFNKGRKALFESMIINGRASGWGLSELDNESRVQKLKTDGHTLFCTVEQYEYENDKIIKANCLVVAPGAGEYFYTDIYNYAC